MRVATQCAQCGQVDDHPKVHIGGELGKPSTKHHDCLSFAEKEMILGSSEATPGAAAQIIEACEGGTRGPDLVAFIEQVHADGGKR